MITRGVISAVNESLGTQGLQIDLRAGDSDIDVEHFQPFGLSFHPNVDSEVLVFAVGGDHDHLVAVTAMDRDVRPTDAKEGEGGLYTPSGWKVFCEHPSGTVNLGAKSPVNALARADRVEAELKLIKATLDSLAGDPARFTKAYTKVGSVGADKVKGE
jgi:phage baseplate assembly protein V